MIFCQNETIYLFRNAKVNLFMNESVVVFFFTCMKIAFVEVGMQGLFQL